MILTADLFLIVCPLAFLAGFLDSIAGGGGVISLPAYYLAGLPPALAAGTNKLSAMMAGATATVNYARAGKIVLRVGIPAVLGALLCSTLGALTLTALPQTTVRILVLCCIPVAALLTLRRPKQREAKEHTARASFVYSFLIGGAIGFYDGLIGPGTGTFLILLFLQVFRMEAVEAGGTAKLTNLASNIAALVSLIATGNVLFLLGIPAGVCGMFGAFLGSKLTIRKGSKFIRVVMLVVLALLLFKILYDILFPA
ncbi:MAG TPA: TSUP family transporter [Candidatus Limiplasma sp.]|nr:TSUP family transporter [Candidatus Limiplasma sp.]HRX09798.1 TSUP family transporter [Candidatus Limiplasma sp.]